MPIPRYERERDRIGSAKAGRAFVFMFAVAGVAGLVAGIIWVIAGLLHLR